MGGEPPPNISRFLHMFSKGLKIDPPENKYTSLLTVEIRTVKPIKKGQKKMTTPETNRGGVKILKRVASNSGHDHF